MKIFELHCVGSSTVLNIPNKDFAIVFLFDRKDNWRFVSTPF